MGPTSRPTQEHPTNRIKTPKKTDMISERFTPPSINGRVNKSAIHHHEIGRCSAALPDAERRLKNGKKTNKQNKPNKKPKYRSSLSRWATNDAIPNEYDRKDRRIAEKRGLCKKNSVVLGKGQFPSRRPRRIALFRPPASAVHCWPTSSAPPYSVKLG